MTQPMWAWQDGPHGGNYRVLPLLRVFNLVARLVYIPTHGNVSRHTDPYTEDRQFGLAILLRKPQEGGDYKPWRTLWSWWRFTLFRPDHTEHEVVTVTQGSLLMLSMRWTLPRRQEV